jgi:hypothetical protein
MKNKTILIGGLTAALLMTACKASVTTSTNPAKPAAANSTAPANTTAAAPKKETKPKTELKNEKKPEGSAKTANKDVPLPKDWIYIYDEQKGYGFSVPAGSTGNTDSVNGVDISAISTPEPADIGILAFSYKDQKLSKDDLLNDAVGVLEGMGQKVTPGKLKEISGDYSVADATTTDDDGKGKVRILVGTDVTDNYILIVGTDEDKFAANEKIIDEIWGSFEMWSGGNEK